MRSKMVRNVVLWSAGNKFGVFTSWEVLGKIVNTFLDICKDPFENQEKVGNISWN